MWQRQLTALILVPVLVLSAAFGQQETEQRGPTPEQLERLLKANPEADANKDGKLTLQEARAYRQKMRGADPARPDAAAPDKPEPTHADVHYGPHERQVIDFYQVKSDKPTPVIVYIHGGGFVGGNKDSYNPAMLKAAHDAGISFATVHYRFVDGEKIIFPIPQQDGARAIQFLRSKAKAWNIDPQRIAAYGGSAGAGISMWIGFHDDLAQSGSDDPVARESTRLRALGTFGGQGTYDPIRIKEMIGGRAWEHPSLLKVYGLESKEEALNPSPEAKKLYTQAAAITHLTKDDPPLFMVYSEPDIVPPVDSPPGKFIHHPNFGKQLKAEMDKLGIENVYLHTGQAKGENVQLQMFEFLKKHLVK